MTSSFKPDSKAPELAWSEGDFRPNHWPEADEAFRQAKTRSEQILNEAEERARQMEHEAREKGLEEGRLQGISEGQQRLEPVVKALEEACHKIQQTRSNVLWESERDLVRLAVLVARCVLRRELSTRDEVIGQIVSHALKEVDLTDILSLNIHPEDWEILNDVGLVGGESGITLPRGIQVVREESVGRGGCVIRSDIGTIDGRLEEQLSAILARFEDELERNRPASGEES